jgi:hypothetical protein
MHKIEVKKGQIWASNDRRDWADGKPQRFMRVIAIYTDVFGLAVAIVERCAEDGGGVKHLRTPGLLGRRVFRIAVSRMRPTASGYILIKDIE